MLVRLLLMTLITASSLTASDLNTDVQRWMIVNDSVMGGVSNADLSLLEDQKTFRFSGVLSLENNGGFASVRAIFPRNYFMNSQHICIRVKGDGQTYQLRLRGSRQFDGISFAKKFATNENEWATYKFALSEFEPTFRGRVIPNVRDIRNDEIRQVSFMITDKQEGPFRLDFTMIEPCNPEAFV